MLAELINNSLQYINNTQSMLLTYEKNRNIYNINDIDYIVLLHWQ